MARFARWDVVAVPFVYVEGDEAKRRPAVVVSSAELAERHGLYWVAMITSAEHRRWPDDIVIDDPAEIGLAAPCVIRPCKLATIDEERIVRRIGALPSRLRNALHACLRRYSP
jgi:mRNA interferase MazF